MKSSLLLSGFFLFFCTMPLFAQPTDCKELLQENEYLRKTLKILAPVKSANFENIDFSILTCEGNIKEQTIRLTLLITNRAANTEISFRKSNVVDIQGNEFESSGINIGSGGFRGKVYTDTPVKAVFEFRKILPATKLLKLIAIEFTGNKGGFEFKDIPVTWR
ncbi:hypothetical protein [Parasegetibacter sp. NRK P23]|uniref:hypothetical protein n=1 Tax=Parasegetibacter sp. NRK P23 TaxID=2942999 RepID=UPI002044AE2A|nr:hypothetical protein [Parasegetibacter sp. NRK P23]MCM5528021.1 hypothetical protein [Parasegetibacter sp. NRK P23]